MLTSQDHVLRLWNEGTVISSDESALDEVIVEAVIQLEHEQLIGYSFITNRIWILVYQGILTFRGIPGPLYRYSVKRVHKKSKER